MYDTTAALRPSIQNLSERISFIVGSFPLCLTFLWKWSMFRLVTWELLGRTIGCLTSKGKVEFSSLPPTLISPFSSMKGSNFKRKLWLEILAFCFFRLKLIISFFYSHGICLKMCLSASCCSATVVLAVLAVLLERSLEVWNHSYCLYPTGKSSLVNFKSSWTITATFAETTAGVSFNLGIIVIFIGAMQDFTITNETCTFLSSSLTLRWEHCHYPDMLANCVP